MTLKILSDGLQGEGAWQGEGAEGQGREGSGGKGWEMDLI